MEEGSGTLWMRSDPRIVASSEYEPAVPACPAGILCPGIRFAALGATDALDAIATAPHLGWAFPLNGMLRPPAPDPWVGCCTTTSHQPHRGHPTARWPCSAAQLQRGRWRWVWRQSGTQLWVHTVHPTSSGPVGLRAHGPKGGPLAGCGIVRGIATPSLAARHD
eukprot:2450799-Amphidinium_carterae.2